MTFMVQQLLGYKNIFGKRLMFYENVLARRIGRNDILHFAALMLSYCKLSKEPSTDELIGMFYAFNGTFDLANFRIVQYSIERYNSLHPQFRVGLLCEEALLELYSWAAAHQNITENGNGLGEENSPYFLKLWLIFNDRILERFEKAVRTSNKYEDRQNLRRILAERFPQNDFIDIEYGRLIFCQCYKLMELLNFLESNHKYQPLFQHLLQDFKVDSKEVFFKAIGGAIIIPLNFKTAGLNKLTVGQNVHSNSNIEFLNNLAHIPYDIDYGSTDFKNLRDRPFRKIEIGEYEVIFDLFLIKKLYNGVIFKLSSYVDNQPDLLNGPLFGEIRNDFTEGVIVYNNLEAIVSKTKTVTISGDEFKVTGLQREPDFYCRYENQILLIESKDFFIPAAIKLSYSFKEIMDALGEDRLKKATKQLAKNVSRLLLEEMPLDNDYDSKNILIYPAIVTHDSLYNSLALNYWVNDWFQEFLSELKGDQAYDQIDFSIIMPLTIIDIDTLILYRNCFEKAELNIFSLIEEYQQKASFSSATDINFQNAIIPFDAFCDEYVLQKGLKIDLDLLHNTYNLSGYKD